MPRAVTLESPRGRTMAAKSIGSKVLELRMLYCPFSPASAGLRCAIFFAGESQFFCGGEHRLDSATHPPLASPALPRAGRSFALNQYPAMKVANPTLPILLREGKEITPKIYARFGAMQAGSQQWAMCQAEG